MISVKNSDQCFLLRLLLPLPDVPDERMPAKIGQYLARQAGGAKTGGNDGNKFHGYTFSFINE